MKNKLIDEPHEIDFKTRFKGKFYGVLRWQQLDELWQIIKDKTDDGWYCYEVSKTPPAMTVKGKALEYLVDQIDGHLRAKHDENYCGVVYVDDFKTPSIIKVFDPKNMGTSCSIGTTAPLPEWVISKLKPDDLTVSDEPKKYQKRWLGNLFSK